jgi:two-component system chemotaxis response regulator CheB
MRGHPIVVIGTSAGGVGALQEILKGLPQQLPASIFVVMHLPPHVPSFLDDVLRRRSRLPVQQVTGPTRFSPAHIYIACPDHHLILGRAAVTIQRGPRENWHRPSVDVLFRSAATSHGPRVIGVVLTGFLDDGTAGLAAIQREGGLTIVQDPEDAMFPDMPANALQNVNVDHVLPLAEIGAKLVELVRKPAGERPRHEVPPEVAIESAIARSTMGSMNGRAALEKLGRPSTYTCPECQGPLWELRDGQRTRFRCQVGHAFSAESMLTAQQDVVERALWVAVGAIESRIALWRKLAGRMKSPHLMELAKFYQAKESEAIRDLAELRQILTRSGDFAERGRSRGRRAGSPPRASAGSGASEARRRPDPPGRRPQMSRRT